MTNNVSANDHQPRFFAKTMRRHHVVRLLENLFFMVRPEPEQPAAWPKDREHGSEQFPIGSDRPERRDIRPPAQLPRRGQLLDAYGFNVHVREPQLSDGLIQERRFAAPAFYQDHVKPPRRDLERNRGRPTA